MNKITPSLLRVRRRLFLGFFLTLLLLLLGATPAFGAANLYIYDPVNDEHVYHRSLHPEATNANLNVELNGATAAQTNWLCDDTSIASVSGK
jgi:hypothetical protein